MALTLGLVPLLAAAVRAWRRTGIAWAAGDMDLTTVAALLKATGEHLAGVTEGFGSRSRSGLWGWSCGDRDGGEGDGGEGLEEHCRDILGAVVAFAETL